MSSSIPKFGSFKPKPKAPEKPPPEEPRQKERDRSRHSSSREKPRSERRRSSPPHEKRERTQDDSLRKPYFSDRRGDRDIIKYGTLNRYDVPTYRRSGYGKVLGIPDQKIDREYSTDQKMYMVPLVRQQQKRLLTDKHAARESRRTLRLVKAAENHQADASRDFIALSNTRKRKRAPDSGSEGDSNDEPDIDYRGIAEKPDPDKADDPDTYYESDVEAATVNSEVTQKNSRLVRETRDEPGNLQAWLDLVQHQELMMKLDRATTELSVADRHNLADVRITMYGEALRKVGSDESSQTELQLGLLREAQWHWDDAKLAAKWQEVLKKYPCSVKLWFGYLDFVQSSFALFKYEDCRAAFIKALEALRSAKTTTSETRLHLFVRLTTMIHDAGYQELALAIWQACFEFHLLAPQDCIASDKLARFEEFWESEAPRIGEPDSKGWKATSLENVAIPACSIVLDAFDPSDSSPLAFQRREMEAINKLRYPGRSTDDVGDEDPFHTIFFSDLEEYITAFPEVSAESQIDAFLCFCGLPPLVGTGTSGPWWDDPFLQRSTIHADPTEQPNTSSLQYEDALLRYSQSPLGRYQMTSDLLVQHPFSLDASALSPQFVRHTLKLLALQTSIAPAASEAVGAYLLAFEGRHFPADIAKSAKRLLKDKPASVPLYNMYGLVEDHLGNAAKAEHVFAAALNIKTQSEHHLQLRSSYVWQALRRGDANEALRRLEDVSTIPSSPQTTPISAYQTLLESHLLTPNLPAAILTTSLLAIHTYLISPSSSRLPSALQTHANLTTWLTSHSLSLSPHSELNAQATACLLAHHASQTPILRPSTLRTALTPLLALFPTNTRLLASFAANEARAAIDDRVHGHLSAVLQLTPSSPPAAWAFAIHHELLRGVAGGATPHSVRALLARATARGSAGERCRALWLLYLSFERAQLAVAIARSQRYEGRSRGGGEQVEQARERVRELVYEGVKKVPGWKGWVVGAFEVGVGEGVGVENGGKGEGEGVFKTEELVRFYRLLGEKEMRVYTEMDMDVDVDMGKR